MDVLYPAAAVTVLNAGVSGDTAPNGAKRLERDVLARRPDLVVIAFELSQPLSGWSTEEGGKLRILDRLRARNTSAGESAPVGLKLIACIGDSVTHGCFEVFINHRGGD